MSEVTHKGLIVKIDKDTIFVRILQYSACGSCKVVGYCSAADKKEKIIEIHDDSNSFQLSEEVEICGQSSLGLKAVFYAFIIPLFILVASLIVCNIIGFSDVASAIYSLVLLIVYYIIIYLFRKKMKKLFKFSLKKL